MFERVAVRTGVERRVDPTAVLAKRLAEEFERKYREDRVSAVILGHNAETRQGFRHLVGDLRKVRCKGLPLSRACKHALLRHAIKFRAAWDRWSAATDELLGILYYQG